MRVVDSRSITVALPQTRVVVEGETRALRLAAGMKAADEATANNRETNRNVIRTEEIMVVVVWMLVQMMKVDGSSARVVDG